MLRHDLPEGAWTKSSYSGDNGGSCVETQPTVDGLFGVGDSKGRTLGATPSLRLPGSRSSRPCGTMWSDRV
ncbi:DUF397 domain-containing protein [Streptomyces sp. NBC_01433]|uniref:DUF397 domain-containing protein n=1 Tax=Streptomyces sp. NBC_01433 TaxID=2903864 RepID=UPI002B1CC85C|nr:DUF397 domain-containing protein [Streptomyces sp. NBC_01433]